MLLKITVTKKILEQSKMCGFSPETRGNISHNCAIILAIQKLFPEGFVGSRYIHFDGYGSESVLLPPIAKKFINNFDSIRPEERVKMPEIAFEVEVPESISNKWDISSLTEILKDSETLELINC